MPERRTPVELGAAYSRPAGSAGERLYDDTSADRRVVVIGAPEDVPRALQHPAVLNRHFVVCAAVAVDVEADSQPETLAELARIIDTNSAKTILIAGPVGPGTMRRVADLALLRNCSLLAVMPTEVLTEHDPVVVWSGESPLVQLARSARGPAESRAKRAIDVMTASIGLFVTAPILAVLSVLISIESRGAPIFRHERVGRGGRRFGCLKLRTMRAGAEERLKADPELLEEYRRNHFKIPDDRDPRVTRLGRFLRRTSLDELPQLWNVLVGDMSLVGPRPVVEDELEMYGHARDLLLSVRPGLTGAWAVNGRHGVGYPDRCELELDYVRRWDLGKDSRILVRTIGVLVKAS